VLVALHVLLAWLARVPGIFSDEAVYVALARALRGFEYRELFHVNLPAHRMYPPGYPAVLAVWSALGGERFDWLVLVNLAASAAALLFIFAAIKERWGSTIALVCLSATAFNFALITSAGWVLSEAPFMLCTAIALWAAAGTGQPETSRRAILAGAYAIAAALMRTAGAAVAAALGLYWLLRGQYRRAAILAAASALTIGAWFAFTTLAPSHVPGSSYVADAVARPADTGLGRAIAARVSNNVLYAPNLYTALMPTIPGTRLDDALGAAIAGAAVLVGLFLIAREWPAAAAYVIVYGALLLVWPWRRERFLTPLLPWLVTATILGIGVIVSTVRRSWNLPAMCLAAGILALNGAADAIGAARHRQTCQIADDLPSSACLMPWHAAWSSFFSIVRHVREHVEPAAIFVSPAPATLYLVTGHRSIPLTEALDRPSSEFLAFLRERGATHVVLSDVAPFTEGKPRLSGAPLGRMVMDNCQAFRLEASFDASAYLFRVDRESGADAAQAACHAAADFVTRFDRTPR
jgi:hypothetical protein